MSSKNPGLMDFLKFPTMILSLIIHEMNTVLHWVEVRTGDRSGNCHTYAQIRQLCDKKWGMAAQYEESPIPYYVNLALFALIPLSMVMSEGHLDTWYLKPIAIATLTLMLTYFIWLYFKRTPAGLMENVLGMIVLGNIEGLMLTTQGIWMDPWVAVILGLAVACWVVKALVLGVMQAELLGIQGGVKRGAHLFVQLGYSLAPALLILGLCFFFPDYAPWDAQVFIGEPRKALGLPLLLAAFIFIIAGFTLTRKARKAAWLELEGVA